MKAETFRPYRIQQQQQLINDVVKETAVENDILTDHISERVRANKISPGKRVCSHCLTVVNQVSNRICPECKYTVQNHPNRDVLYGNVESKHPTSPPSVKMGEIVDLNPNSAASIKALLFNLREQAGVWKQEKVG